jgi:nitrous-oxide reductase
MKRQIQIALGILIVFIAVALVFHSCKPGKEAVKSEAAEAALATYVSPGDLDEFYLFYSGGHSGQIFVAGIPSMRHIATIPVFTPFNFDLGDAGKGPSHGWVFWTCYNSERATGILEITASQNDRDYIAAVNWKKAEEYLKAGKYKIINGVRVIDPKEAPGVVYLLPCAKSPHGVDVSPDGKWIVGSGKLQSITTVYNFEKMLKAIENKDFVGEEDGIPVLRYESVREAEVPVGLGPLHTQFDDKGYAYTSLFVESAIAKWKLGTWEVVDKIPIA